MDTAISYGNLAGVYTIQGKYKNAITYYFKAFKIDVLKLGLSHPDTQNIYKCMVMAFVRWNPEGNFEQWLEEKLKEE